MGGINSGSLFINKISVVDKEEEQIKGKLTSTGKIVDPMTYEMELNRIDFRNDISSILDQIEKEFEINSVANMGTSLASISGHVDLSNLHLDTPPDSDSENNPQIIPTNVDPERNSTKLQNGENLNTSGPNDETKHLLAFDRLTKRIRLNELEDLELIDTSKSEIDKLLGDDQLYTGDIYPSKDTFEKGILGRHILKSRAKQKQLTTAESNQSGESDQFQNNHDTMRLKVNYLNGSVNATEVKDHKIQTLETNCNSAQNGSILTSKISSSVLSPKIAKRKLLQCQSCPATFIQLNDLQTHVSLTHKTKISTSCNNTQLNAKFVKKERSTATKNFICSLCDKGFVQKSHLTRHMKIHGIDKKNGVTELPNPNKHNTPISQEQFECRICMKNCKNKVGLVRHRAKHLACVQCSEVFNNKVSLQEHLLKVHTKSAVISIEQPLPSPSPPPLLDSPTGSISSLLFQEQNDMNDSFFIGNMQNGAAKKIVGTTTGPKDERLSIVVSPNEVSNIKNSISGHIDTSLSPDNISESFADISNADYLESCNEQGLSDEFYPTDLF